MRDDTHSEDFTEPMMTLHSLMGIELGQWSSRLLKMIRGHGGHATAVSIVRRPEPTKMFCRLAAFDRLDLTIEAWILRSEWHQHFTVGTKIRAYRRLKAHDFTMPPDSWQPGHLLANLNATPHEQAA